MGKARWSPDDLWMRVNVSELKIDLDAPDPWLKIVFTKMVYPLMCRFVRDEMIRGDGADGTAIERFVSARNRVMKNKPSLMISQWSLAHMKTAGVPDDLAAKLEALVGEAFATRNGLRKRTAELLSRGELDESEARIVQYAGQKANEGKLKNFNAFYQNWHGFAKSMSRGERISAMIDSDDNELPRAPATELLEVILPEGGSTPDTASLEANPYRLGVEPDCVDFADAVKDEYRLVRDKLTRGHDRDDQESKSPDGDELDCIKRYLEAAIRWASTLGPLHPLDKKLSDILIPMRIGTHLSPPLQARPRTLRIREVAMSWLRRRSARRPQPLLSH